MFPKEVETVFDCEGLPGIKHFDHPCQTVPVCYPESICQLVCVCSTGSIQEVDL